MTVMRGLTNELTKPRNSPTNAKLSQGSAAPNGAMPGTRNVAMAMAMDVRSQLRKKRMRGLSVCVRLGYAMTDPRTWRAR